MGLWYSMDTSMSLTAYADANHTGCQDTRRSTSGSAQFLEDYQKYGALILDGMINQDIKDSKAYKTYLDYATGKVPPKKARKFKKPVSPKLKIVLASPKEPTQKDTPGKSVSKKKAPAKTDRGKEIELLSDATLLEDAQLKKTLRKSKQETHKLQASGSSEGADFESEVPDEQTGKTKDTSKGTSVKPGVLDVSKEDSSDSDDDSLGNNEDENDDLNDEDDDGGNDDGSGNADDGGNDAEDSEQTDLDDDENPSFTLKDYEEEEQDEEYVHTPEKEKSDDEEKMYEEEDDDVAKELYGDLNITQGLKDTDMTNAEQDEEDQQNASHESGFKYKELYDALVKSYNLDKDIFLSYGKAYSLKRDHEDKDKDKDPPVGSDLGLKKRKKSKDAEPSKGSKSKESKSSSSSKGTKPQPKSSGKSTQAEEPVFEAAYSEMQQDQGSEFAHMDDQPDDEAAPKHDWFKKPDKPPTPNRARNKAKSINFRPPQTWINNIAKARQPPRTFDELMSTPIDFLAYVINHLKIDNLTQEILVGPAFNLLKVTCKSFVELEFHFEECYKDVNDRLDWNNPEGHEYSFDLSKPLPLIEVQGRQVVPADYFINNDLEYLKSGNSSRRYMTSTTKTKAAKYDNIEDMYLEDIEVRREDKKLYTFKEGHFPRLNIHIVILHRVEDLQLGVESYQKMLNITRPETFRSDITNLTQFTAYKNPQGIIHLDKYRRNRFMRSDELCKFCDGTLSYVRTVLNDIANILRMDYLPKRK
nr:hypothetical protein [Tanacetum cinerariifolium]